jgi:hypothetical protein
MLLSSVVESLARESGVRRIESQLMMFDSGFGNNLPKSGSLTIHRRNFMSMELAQAPKLAAGSASGSSRF